MIDNLDCLGSLSSLYLQNNAITIIENLEGLSSLQYLNLSRNAIQSLPDLTLVPSAALPPCARAPSPWFAGAPLSAPAHLSPCCCSFLHHLLLLDLSFNRLDAINVSHLPPRLAFLDLRGNGCVARDGYRCASAAVVAFLSRPSP